MTSPDKKTTSAPPPPPPSAKGPPPGVPAAPTTSAASAATPPANAGAASTQPNGSAAADAKEPNRSKYFVVVGKVHEFTSAAQAEKFLNEPGAPAEFSVVRGHRVKSKQRVSLR